MIEIVAEVVLFAAERGGLNKPVRNGLRPSFHFAGELVSCEIWAESSEEFVPCECLFRARIKLPYADALGWRFEGGESFKLNVASQVIGRGCVLAMRSP